MSLLSLIFCLQNPAFAQSRHGHIDEQVTKCGWVNVAPEDKWRSLDGLKTARLQRGEIELTYQISGCPNTNAFVTAPFPSCQLFHREIENTFQLIQGLSSKVHFRRVEANANIKIAFGTLDGSNYAQVFHLDSNGQEVTRPQYLIGEQFNVRGDPNRRASSTNMVINQRHCFWIDDRSVCQTPNAIKPLDTPAFKILVLHEIMHTLGFQHTQCHRDLSVVGGLGGHGRYEINDFDLRMIETYYARIIRSYQNP